MLSNPALSIALCCQTETTRWHAHTHSYGRFNLDWNIKTQVAASNCVFARYGFLKCWWISHFEIITPINLVRSVLGGKCHYATIKHTKAWFRKKNITNIHATTCLEITPLCFKGPDAILVNNSRALKHTNNLTFGSKWKLTLGAYQHSYPLDQGMIKIDF